MATSAVREAANGEDFLARVKAQTGLDVQLLTGEEEGRLIYRAVREVVDLGPGTAAIVDVGGGSTEWITARAGELEHVVSLTLGSLRGAGSLEGDPPGGPSLERYRRRVQERLAEAVPAGPPVERLVATSGTAVCCADLIDFFAGRDWKEIAGRPARGARQGPGAARRAAAAAAAARDRRPAAGGRSPVRQPARRRRPAPGAGRSTPASTASR